MKAYILNRPVNSLKKLYLPSYLGAKIRAAKSSAAFKSAIELSIKKRLHSSESWNYKKFKVFKGMDEAGSPEYRDYLAPSPSASAAEAYILNALSLESDFSRARSVYSYVRTAVGNQHNYEYYLYYYKLRNQDILHSMKEGASKALFIDIKNFYPSIDKSNLLGKLKNHPVIGLAKYSFVIDFLDQQLSECESGVPIGTELSHLLADIYLSSLDEKLQSLLGENYFRYVDDITLVGDSKKIEAIEKEIEIQLDSLGLTLNQSKREVFSVHEWEHEMDTSPVEGEDFYEYCKNLGEQLVDDQGYASRVDAALKSEGFQIPINKILAKHKNIERSQIFQVSEKKLVEQTKNMRQKYISATEKVSENMSRNPTRWYLQKAKRAINPLFYLLNKEEYPKIMDAARESGKLKVQEEVSSAIYKNDCTSIIKFPGVAINTFCEMWKVQESSWESKRISNEHLSEPEIDSITILALYDVVQPPLQVQESSIWKALRPDVTARSASLTGFDSEIESLRIGISKIEQTNLLDGRLSDDEDILLSGLELGNESIS